MQEGLYVVPVELGAAVEEVEFEDEAEAGDAAAEVLDQFGDGGGRASGGEDVVDDQDLLAGNDGVPVNFQRIGAVFERVFDALDGGGQFIRLADGNEAGADGVGEDGSEDEAAGLDANDGGDPGIAIPCAEGIDDLA